MGGFYEDQIRKIKERDERRLNPVAVQPVVEEVVVADACPACGASGSDPCVTASGKVKETWHAKRGS